IADLGDDDKRDEGEAAELGLKGALALCVAESCDPFDGGGEGDTLAGQAGPDRDRDRQMALAGAGRAQQHDVLLAVQEVQLAEVLDHLLLDGALEGEVELLERLAGGEAGRLDPALAAAGLARAA